MTTALLLFSSVEWCFLPVFLFFPFYLNLKCMATEYDLFWLKYPYANIFDEEQLERGVFGFNPSFFLDCRVTWTKKILTEDVKITLNLKNWILWTSDLKCLLFNIYEMTLEIHYYCILPCSFQTLWHNTDLNFILINIPSLFNLTYCMLQVLEEVLKQERLTGGLLVESLGICKSGKG